MKRIGVVIPIYNTAQYLCQCIDSILNQPYDNMIIILVDDGSTDESPKICDMYAAKESRIRVIHQKNSGKLVARYKGARAADCDYLTFVDSDDWIESNTYENFVQQMERGVDVISWQIIRYYTPDFQKVSMHNYSEGLYEDKSFRTIIYPTMIWHFDKNVFGIDPSLCNKLIKRNIALQALNSAQGLNISYGDDVAVTYPLFQSIHTLFLSSKALYYHRKRTPEEIPSYFKDNDYYGKLYVLYEYLRRRFAEEPIFLDQLDAFYSFSVSLHLGSNKNPLKQLMYIFPFDEVPFGKKIILYGASTVGQSYYNQLRVLGYANEILWVDKNYKYYVKWDVRDIESLWRIEGYDYAVIAIENECVANKVKEYLSNCLKQSRTKVVWSIKKISSI